MTPQTGPLDLGAVRARLANARGPEFWRSLDELSQSPGFQELLEREFPQQVPPWAGAINRRTFLALAGASLAMAGLSGCAQAPRDRIFPYTRQPEDMVPGRPLYFATAMPLAGYGQGLLVESHEGRPTKVEGNPEHPGSPPPPDAPEHNRFGPTDLFAQASVLSLYDPDRAQAVTHLGNTSNWDALLTALRTRPARTGQGWLRILTETVTSPTLAHQLRQVVRQLPAAKWHVYEPVGRANTHAGARRAFDEVVDTQYDFEKADVVLTLDADFLSCGPGSVRHVRDFCSRRRGQGENRRAMNRLYVVESTPSGTGAMADHRLPLRSGLVKDFARAVAVAVREQLQGKGASSLGGLGEAPTVPGVDRRWIAALAKDLVRCSGRSLVVTGDSQPPFVHALAHALNDALENVGKTVRYTSPVEFTPASEKTSLGDLVEDMRGGRVDVLLVLGGNPVYTAPADLDFAEAMDHVGLRVHLGLYEDETSAACHWHVPEAHYLESWGDVRGTDGTVSIVQPLIAPLYNGRTAHDVLDALTQEQSGETTYQRVRAFWQSPEAPRRPEGDFETWWRRALHNGYIEGTGSGPRKVTLRREWAKEEGEAAAGKELEIVFRPDPTLFDGRFANNGWLQELPKPISKLTWDNAALISPATAVKLGYAPKDHPEEANEQVVELAYEGRRVEAPLLVTPGHADDSITVHLGHGRTRAGRVGTGIGFDAYRLRTGASPWFGGGLVLRGTGRKHELAFTQHHHLMENRDLVRAGTVEQPPRPKEGPRRSLTLYNEEDAPRGGNQWGMVIDLTACTGCGACVVACQAENNIPVVGKDQVRRGREMHWLRIDSYYRGDAANPETYFQPVPCMHCENAPCEVVCPVGATAHSSDGLNDMVYNRCVGTRYCSNNCPYKVRRFNFYQFADFDTESLKLGRNPEVTVRSRGVMEKCTYCVQRIRHAQIDAQRADRAVRDGEVVTACQGACPARAIVFGDLADRTSRVAGLRKDPHNYGLLDDLNTRPRTTYLTALKNPNQDINELERG